MGVRPPRPGWMPSKQKRKAPPLVLRRAKEDERAFGYEAELLRLAGEKRSHERKEALIKDAVQIMYGLGRALRGEVDELALRCEERLSRCLAQCKTEKRRLGVGWLHLQLLAELRHYATHGYRATGPVVFFGSQHDGVHEDGERAGKRKYLPMLNELGEHLQGGLAKRAGVSTRTILRWWRHLNLEVWSASRPPRNGRGVVMNRRGTQAYSQRYLVCGVPRAVLDRLPLSHLHKHETGAPYSVWETGRLRSEQLERTRNYLDDASTADFGTHDMDELPPELGHLTELPPELPRELPPELSAPLVDQPSAAE